MTIWTCWSAKGGSGTTVVAAGIALSTENASGTVLIDLDGELPVALGLPEPDGQGLADWFESDAPPSSVLDLAVDAGPSRLVPRGASAIDPDHARWSVLASWMTAQERTFVVDAATGLPPPALRGSAAAVSCAADHDDGERDDRGCVEGDRQHSRASRDRHGVLDVLVTRPCYLALRRAAGIGARPGGVIVVSEAQRALSRRDVARSIGAPVLAEVPIDPAIGRAVDAGLLAFGLPKSLHKALRGLQLPTSGRRHIGLDHPATAAR